MMAGIWGFLQALPQLLSMINNFMGWINRVSGNDGAGFLLKAGTAFDQLNKAKTPEDHMAAAKAISDLIKGTPAK